MTDQNIALLNELTSHADTLEAEAAKYRKAAAILQNGHSNGIVYNVPNPLLAPGLEAAMTNGNGHPRRGHRLARAVKALGKHGPMPPSVLCAYTGIPRINLSAYVNPWIRAGHVAYDDATGRYTLPAK